ncbi:ABC transporter ATP-binding protein [Propionicimonas sp.]|uniref:ABC transporter ATP-binding protein n=1 Tax=Propionicimonas sp. TaxID=1955623 RepID=UPI0039E4A8AF
MTKHASLRAIPVVIGLAWRTDRRRLIIGAGLVLLGTLAQPGVALGVRTLTDQALAGGPPGPLGLLAFVVAGCLVAQLMLSHFGHLWYFELGELVEIELNLMVAGAIHHNQPLEAVERPEVADGIDLARADIARIRSTVEATILLATVALQLLFTCVLLASVSPWLLLLPAAATLPVIVTSRAEAPLQRAREQAAGPARRVRQARDATTIATQVKETRLGAGHRRLVTIHDRAQLDYARTMRRGYAGYLARRAAGQLPFAIALVAAIGWSAHLAGIGQASTGDVVMVLALTTQVGGQVANAIAQLNTVTQASAGVDRILSLAATLPSATGLAMPPEHGLSGGIELNRLTYTYPDARDPALADLNLRIPAGSAVAVVGENGAGKSTLIKLLQGLYQPTAGTIAIDGIDLADLRPEAWHARSTALFQDFTHLDFTAKESIGVGEIENIDDSDAVHAAVGRARADGLVEAVGGLGTVLGTRYRAGRELSGGQWQSVGLARALMHERPLLLTLDEPGHSLDPEAEIAMVEAYERAAADYARRSGAIAFYVTHRLSSVRNADLVLVLRNGRVDAVGRHDQLLAGAGYYADLYTMQADAYSTAASRPARQAGSG